MNVSRSTSMWWGRLLTAFAVAALLVMSAETAWAQSVRIARSTGVLEESASTNAATPDPLVVKITRSGNFDSADTSDDDMSVPDTAFKDYTGDQLEIEVEYNGEALVAGDGFTVTARSGDATDVVITTGATTGIKFGADISTSDDVATEIELTIEDTDPDDGDWNEEKLVLKLASTAAFNTHVRREDGVSLGTKQLTVTIRDDEQMPQFKFVPTGIQLAKGNTQKVTVGVGVGPGGRVELPTGDESIRATLAALTDTRDDVLLSVSPSGAVGTLIEFVDRAGAKVNLKSAGQDMYNIGKIGHDNSNDGAVGAVAAVTDDGIELRIKAIAVSGFRDEQITLSLMDGRTEAQKTGDGGGIDDSDPATVTILSGEETPTVTFSKSSVNIEEGGSETVHILADTDQGDKVGSVAVSVRGEATIVLEQGGGQISGGVVQFGGSANAELTIVSLSDPALEDGEEKTATVTITDASGANIGDPRELMVTVVGSTAVPVLPLVGQLLLALLLTVGGARLYRRRQQ